MTVEQVPPTTILFLGTVGLYLYIDNRLKLQQRRIRRRENESTSSSPSISVPSNSLEGLPQASLTKDQIMGLRQRRFAKNVTVSYSNTGSGGIMMVQGKGARLFDEQGNSYLDTRNNVAHCGHCHDHIVRAVQQQVQCLNTNTRYLHPHVTRLADRLVQLLPSTLNKVFFVNSGSEANDLALRLARAHTNSKNTIVVQGAYHGHTLACLQVSPYKYKNATEFPLTTINGGTPTPGSHIWQVPCPDTYRYDDAAMTAAQHVLEACRTYTKEREKRVGAFLVEGGMSVAGVILPPPGYLTECVAAVRTAGGVYIADEIQTGFGRLGTCMWAFQYNTKVVPDIVTVGKPFGNGMPLAAVVCSQEIADSFDALGIEYFNTFGGNPVSAAAGLAVLDVMESEGLQANACQVGDYLKTKFIQLQETYAIIGDVRGSGFFIGVELVRDHETKEPASTETSFICTTLKEKYFILTSIDGLYDNVLVIKPPMVFSMADADEFLDSFERVVRDDLVAFDGIHTMTKTPT